MRPRRQVFGLDYIEEVVDLYATIVSDERRCSEHDSGELKWAHDVLQQFFATAGEHPKIDRLRTRFQKLTPALASQCEAPPRRSVPYRSDDRPPLSVSYEMLRDLAVRRRSIRWFQPQSVPREVVQKAVAVAAQSPSACNRQPFYFRVIDDPREVTRIASIPYGTAGYAENVPAIVVVVGQLRNYCYERDRHLIYIDGSLAAMSFILALETMGVGSCCINWADIGEREKLLAETLELQPDERAVMFIGIGYPDPEGLVAYSEKKSLAQLCRFNFE